MSQSQERKATASADAVLHVLERRDMRCTGGAQEVGKLTGIDTLALKIGAVPMVVCTKILLWWVSIIYHGDERHCGRS